MDKPRPYVTAAMLCEKVIQEKDESITIVRIADTLQYSVEGVGLPAGIKPMINIQGFVSLKSGSVVGDHAITIIVEKPSGDRNEILSVAVNFRGKEQGQNIILRLGLGVEQDGLYWFDVAFDGDVLTRIPLAVMPMQKETSVAKVLP